MAARLGIVTGLRAEAAILGSLSRRFDEAARPDVRCAGPGAAAAERAAQGLAASGVAGLVSFGVAGGLDPSLRSGTVVLADRVVADGEAATSGDGLWLRALCEIAISDSSVLAGTIASPGASSGASSGEPVMTQSDKSSLRAATGAHAVDLESAAVARTAAAHGLPFLAIRAIADTAGQALPHAALAAIDAKGGIDIGGLFAALARRPQEFGRIAGLAFAGFAARRGLSRVAVRALPDFAFPG